MVDEGAPWVWGSFDLDESSGWILIYFCPKSGKQETFKAEKKKKFRTQEIVPVTSVSPLGTD